MSPELLATHQILALFEKSKLLSDEMFDSLPGLYFNFASEGSIFRTNKTVAEICKIPHEEILGHTVSEIFSPELWEEFKQRSKTMLLSRKSTIEFEFPVTFGEKTYEYFWQISNIDKLGRGGREIFLCTGRDITDVKQALSKVLALAKNIELTAHVQRLILPEMHEFKTSHLEIAAAYRPAEVASGDYWRLDFLDNDKTWLILGDVTGHGVGPAMVTAMISGCFETHISAKKQGLYPVDLALMFKSANERLVALRENQYWMTALGLEIDTGAKVIRWWSAAAPYFFLLLPDGKIETPDLGSSSMLGYSESSISSGEVPFEKGTRLLILTDGIIEAENPKGRQFDVRSVNKFLQITPKPSPAIARDELLKMVYAWQGEVPTKDDYTFVIIDRIE